MKYRMLESQLQHHSNYGFANISANSLNLKLYFPYSLSLVDDRI